MYITVHVTPDAKRENFTQITGDTFEAAVRAPARHNMANRRVREVVAAHFRCSLGEVRIISGHRSPKKMLVVPESANQTEN